MLKYIVALSAILNCLGLVAQVPEYEYFPRGLCKARKLKTVTVYETKIDDPVAKAGHGNRIRLARNIVRETHFDTTGLRIQSVQLGRRGDIVERDVLFDYDAQGQKISEQHRHFHTNLADSTKLIFASTLRYHYDLNRNCITQLKYLGATLEDSTALTHDESNRLTQEKVYHFNQGSVATTPEPVLEKEYIYRDRKIVVQTKPAGALGNRDEFELDAKGRKIRECNFAAGDTIPRLETLYSYDPRGWLQEITYHPDWRYFSKQETVVSRKNKFDDHGKLVEAQMDYGDGKRLVEFFDHTYWVEE